MLRPHMRRTATFVSVGLLVVAAGALGLRSGLGRRPHALPQRVGAAYSGSGRCRDCHEPFYRLWSTSRHGLSMRPFSGALGGQRLGAPTRDIVVAGQSYRADPDAGLVRESSSGTVTVHPITHVIGGKNVYYFLTPYERGRLQVLPVAYDVRRKEWYDVAASGLRHFAEVHERPVHWTDPEFTFNTSCYGCHVSQLRNSYDVQTDSYRITWAEPGINCETCHGPGEEHIRVVREAGRGKVPADLKLIATSRFTHEQKNDLCAACHARISPITESFRPGDRYFDSFDLVGREDPDFHPDGRDLGENYTFTSWRMSPCAQSGQLDCLHCHTPSGRYRWQDRASANRSCIACHADQVRHAAEHSHHPEGKVVCIDCHMPKTEFARMVRSDHSLRPPTPAATIAFGSPNACNLCHKDKDAAWSDRAVRRWHARDDYQAPALRQGELIAAARKGDWSKLSAMLAAVTGPERDEVMAVAMLRLLRTCPSDQKWPTVLAALSDRSPWVRAAAAATARDGRSPEVVTALLATLRDPVRLPRVRAAEALTNLPARLVPDDQRATVEAAFRELEASLTARPDDFAAQYELGRLYASRGSADRAIVAYENALKLRPDLVAALVNVSLLYNAVARNSDAESVLRRALALEPGNAAAALNLGMLLGELGRMAEAEAALRAALKADPTSAAAAYNLAVLTSRDRLDEAVTWSRLASTLEPTSAKYAYTWAFYLARRGDQQAAISVLRRAIERGAANRDAHALLSQLLEQSGGKAAK
jgi:tetratricopeptide (TPR) repeat protein